MDPALLLLVHEQVAPAPELLQAVPEFFDRPYGRWLLAALVLAVVVLVGRILLAVTWRVILIAVFVFAVLFLASAVFGPL